MNKNMLRSVMALNGDNGGDLAECLGISRARLSAKMNERAGAEFNQGEIYKIKERYNLNADDVVNIFFSQKVS